MLKTTLGGRYSIISRLGAGGFGETYLAEDVQLPDNHCCVVKHLKPQSTDSEILDIARRLFDSEAKVLHKLGTYDQIPRLLANFEENQEFYLVQEFIEGNGLDRELPAGKKWTEAKVINLLQDILTTLEFVHQQKVIHRDIKPENLIRRKQDGKLILIDFGAVKQVCTQVVTNSKRAKSTITIGTSGYMPSEQANGYPHVNSDIYAVGIIGIQALTGLDPEFIPKNANTLELEWSHLVEVSPDLAKILDKMVRFDFRQRYPSATSVLADLETVEISPANPQVSLSTLPTEITLNNQNLATDISANTSSNLATDIEISHNSQNQPTQIISTDSFTGLPELTTIEPKPQIKPQISGKVIIGSAIALITLISTVGINKIYQGNNIALEPPIPAPSNQQKSEAADALLQQVDVLDQVQLKIKNGSKLQDIETLAAKIPETSPLRNKVDSALVKYKTQWEQDKLAFNEVNTAYKARKWKNALNTYKKIVIPYWRQEAKLIVNKAQAAIETRPSLPISVRREVPTTTQPNNIYTAPPQPYYEPPQPVSAPAIAAPSAPTNSEKFSIPEAQ